MVDAIETFLGLVGGILALDREVIRSLQATSDGLPIAVAILLLGCASDVAGNSPLLFIRRMPPGRLAVALVVETLLAVIRLAVWMITVWVAISLLDRNAVALSTLTLVIGIGYAPMLLSVLVLIPTLGPLIGRVLVAWTLVTITGSVAVARSLTPWEALGTSVAAVLFVLLMRRTGDRVVMGLLGSLSRRLVGIDVMERTRALDPARIAAASPVSSHEPETA